MRDIFREQVSSDKGKGVARDAPHLVPPNRKRTLHSFKQRPVRVSLPKLSLKGDSIVLDSDSDLDRTLKQNNKSSKAKLSKLDAFHRLPADKIQEGKSLLKLRALAHLNSPDDRLRGGKPSATISDIQMSLQKRARLQALEERKAKIDELKARGILVQTVEEREKDQAEVEDLLEKARREAEELQQKEKKAAKKAKIANGETNGLDTSDDDDDYEDGEDGDIVDEFSGSDEEEADMADAEKMKTDGSDSEQEEDDEDLVLDEEERIQNPLLDAQAEEDGEEEEEEGKRAGITASDDAEDEWPYLQLPRARRNRIAIEDDEDDEILEDTLEASKRKAEAKVVKMPQIPPMLGKPNPTSVPLGMTQTFAATMADTQPGLLDDTESQEDSMASFQLPPEPDLSLFAAQGSQLVAPDSQSGKIGLQDTAASHQVHLQFSQSQPQYDSLGATQLQREHTELTDIPDPTQDAGFALSSPAPERFVTEPPSTVDTVIVTPTENETSPPGKKRRRLVRQRIVQVDSDHEEATATEAISLPRDVFTAMKEKRERKAAKETFNKKKSEAKDMVEEQAAESEDEYAGLGGASDDESGGEEDEVVKQMMDHGEIDVDEGQLAALFA